jgi:hypothetical protein
MRALSIAIAILALPSLACAQLRAGVPVETLRRSLADGALVLGDVDVPDDAALPVRVAILRDQQPVAILDVLVLGSHDDARAWVAERAPAISSARMVARDADVFADTARGPAAMVLAAHANVALVVRSSDAGVDAAAIAERVSAAIGAAPPGAARPAVPAPDVTDLAIGASRPVQPPSWAIATRVVATGGGYARRTPRGWMITRTSADPIAVRILAVDRYLRISP